MRVAYAVLACVLIASAGRALAAENLALGDGTACVLMPEREAKATLGVKKRHVLACAGPTGRVVRVVITRKGAVECTDAVQVAGDGSTANTGTPCKAVASAREATVPPLVNLTGAWVTDVESLIGPVQCVSDVVQNGAGITIHATCDVGGEFSGGGAIDFEGMAFRSQGWAQIPIYGYCENGRIDASVTPDGQAMSGTLACGSIAVPFTAHRPV